jgi:processive 1,2-diacylglycerol beta-glucosyltransferase
MGGQKMTKRILILSEAFGAGHTKTAEAIKEGVHLLKPEWQVQVLELGTWLRPKMSQFISRFYLNTLRYSPKLWGLMYRRIQHLPVKPRAEFLLHQFFYREIAQLLGDVQPDLIVCTHPFPSAVVSRLKRMGLHVPLYTVITDYAAHGSWISSGVDRYFLPSMNVWEEMTRMGVSQEHLHVTGIPTHPKFWKKKDKREVRQKLGLSNQTTLLCMGGGLGVGLSSELLETIYRFRRNVQILFVTGKNEILYHSLKENPAFQHPNFHVFPFVENINELMDASDVLMTKPGGVTCTEAMSKGIPMILLNPIPGQEEDNCRYFVEKGLGILAREAEQVETYLNGLIQNPVGINHLNDRHSLAYSGEKAIEQIIS